MWGTGQWSVQGLARDWYKRVCPDAAIATPVQNHACKASTRRMTGLKIHLHLTGAEVRVWRSAECCSCCSVPLSSCLKNFSPRMYHHPTDPLCPSHIAHRVTSRTPTLACVSLTTSKFSKPAKDTQAASNHAPPSPHPSANTGSPPFTLAPVNV